MRKPVSLDEVVRCPGCGSVIPPDANRRTCRPIGVDPAKPGYRYLTDTWGYCFTLGVDISMKKTPYLDVVRAQAAEAAADEIQALHPGEVKNSVIFLRDFASKIRRRRPARPPLEPEPTR